MTSLKIAVVGDNYKDCKNFIEEKFGGKIIKVNRAENVYTLDNGDMIYSCYGHSDTYCGMIYDAFIITPYHRSLFEVIRSRCERG